MLPGTFMLVAESTGNTVRVMKNESSAFILKGITPLEKKGAIMIMAFILTSTRRNA
jgi:hypothetical protein